MGVCAPRIEVIVKNISHKKVGGRGPVGGGRGNIQVSSYRTIGPLVGVQ